MKLEESELLQIENAAQYFGGEVNICDKSSLPIEVHFALCFPDTYSVGMSHVGLQLLYQIINDISYAWAERVFTPESKMEEFLRKNDHPIFSLESKRSLNEFDIVGFSLQYELCATNILLMLELGKIPLLAKERASGDPIVIGGGPISYHPEPLAAFFDAFFLGDAEDAIEEISNVIRTFKNKSISETPYSRFDLLKELDKISGVYIPSFYKETKNIRGEFIGIVATETSKYPVVRRLKQTMVGAAYVKKPLVPLVETIHNRLSIEVMRGCVRGCRFCQAGYLYRPQREREPKEILQIIKETLPKSGFDEVSLLSLSTADYCSIVPLLKSVTEEVAGDGSVAISFPSTRVDSLKRDLLEQVQDFRRKNFTMAPEAGTQRLRDVINKGVTDEQIIDTVRNVFTMGWNGVKLYFMIGLPTETDEDLIGIVDLATRLKQLPESKSKRITVSVSTHVPKPHTPFQWAEQIGIEETKRRQRFIKDNLLLATKARVEFRYHQPYLTFLEGVFCRGDRCLSEVILSAYKLGARLDAWGGEENAAIWEEAFKQVGVSPEYYFRERNTEEPLPWDHLSCGISKDYFLKEYKRAIRFRTTPDCLTASCSVCGACNYDTERNILHPRSEAEIDLANRESSSNVVSKSGRNDLFQNSSDIPVRIRIRYRQNEVFRFIGHHELKTIFQRAVSRAGLPIVFSKGFSRRPRLAFGPPLSLGVESDIEYVDLFLKTTIQIPKLLTSLNQALPKGLFCEEAFVVPLHEASVQESIIACRFSVIWISKPSGIIGQCLNSVSGFEKNYLPTHLFRHLTVSRAKEQRARVKSHGIYSRITKGYLDKRFALSEFLKDISLTPGDDPMAFGLMEFTLMRESGRSTPKVHEVISALSGLNPGEYRVKKIFQYERQSTTVTNNQHERPSRADCRTESAIP